MKEKQLELSLWKAMDSPQEIPRGATPRNSQVSPKIVRPSHSEASKNLTPSQKDALEKLKKFLTGKERFFRLVGYAGTGKSYLISHFLLWLQERGCRFVVAAPTNKASKNLALLCQQIGLSVDCTTVAKLLGLQPKLNPETGVEEFVNQREISISDCDVVVIDEFSMVNQDNFTKICQAAVEEGVKVIFVGDAAQLPPVGESEPIVAISPLIRQEVKLNEIVRYDGAIALVAEQIRTQERFNRRIYPFKSEEDQTITCLPQPAWLKIAGDYFASPEFENNPDYCRIIVWRNKTADALNHWVRQRLWGDGCLPFVAGDRLIAKKPLFRLSGQSSTNKKKWSIVLNNSEECRILGEAQPKTARLLKMEWQFWEVPVMTEEGVKMDLRILTPESEQARQEMLVKLREEKRWSEAIALDKSYDWCAFAYALTCHKAQGSSIDHAFIHVGDMRGCRDLQKIQYTALTRARVRAYIVT